MGCDMENVVVGRIDKIEKHPDADKLVVCQVNVGREQPGCRSLQERQCQRGRLCAGSSRRSEDPGGLFTVSQSRKAELPLRPENSGV